MNQEQRFNRYMDQHGITERESIKVLQECIELQRKKSNDYQNPNSTVRQADYYPSGCLTILDTMQAKILRMRSVMEAMVNDPTYKPNFESLEDSAKDLANYASFFVAYSRGKVDGQDPARDFLNRKISGTITMGDAKGTTSLVGAPGLSVTMSAAPGFGVSLGDKS